MPELWRISSEGPNQNAKVRVAALATRQSGLVAHRQLMAIGVARASVTEWERGGYLHRLLPGVYAVGHTAPSTARDLTAALLYAGPGAMLSHATAAWWLGLISRRPDDTIHVSSPRRCRSTGRIRTHSRREHERIWHRDLPTTPVARTLLDFAATAAHDQLPRALAEAEYQGWLELDTLRPMLGRGTKGSAALRRALRAHEPRLAVTRSELERRFLALCRRYRIPAPECNVTVEGYLVDALWRREKVIVELDGRQGHHSWAQTTRDRRRDVRLRAAGHVVLRYVWAQITQDAGAVAADIIASRTGRSAG